MVAHVFFTYREQPIEGWRDAFVQARVEPYAALGTFLASRPEQRVLWLHLRPGAAAGVLVRELVAAAAGAPVVALSNAPSEAEGLAALEAGAAGYCSALAAPAVLRQVATTVASGGVWIGQALMQRLLAGLARRQVAPADALAGLSGRERQVALAVARGATNKEIARAMAITERTVKAHLTAIFAKLKVRDRLALSLLVNGVDGPTPKPQRVSA